jgi:hypothetical protein
LVGHDETGVHTAALVGRRSGRVVRSWKATMNLQTIAAGFLRVVGLLLIVLGLVH